MFKFKNSNCNFVLIFFLFFVNFAIANDEIISSVSVEGNQRIDKETVISYSNVELGDIYTEELGNNILKELFDSNLFSNITVSFNNNNLLISITENPTVNLVKFQGNKKIKDEDLLIEISLKERSVYSRSKVKKDIERMLSLYQRAGRLSTQINPTVEVLENNRVNITYEIDESDITEVSKIVIIGNEVFTSSKIKSIMKTKEKTLLRFLSSSDRYDPDKLEYDKSLVAQHYNNNGYPNFKFISSIAQLSPNSNDYEIILTVKEGEKFKFGNIEVTSSLKKMVPDAILEDLSFSTGDTYNYSQVSEAINQIKDIADFSGYSFIEIDPRFRQNDENNTVDVNIILNEGPRVYVNKINIVGNTRTIDKVIRREMNISEGDAYNKYAINFSTDSIRALNYFSEVELDETRTEFPDKIDLNIKVEEKNTGEASLGAGYSSATEASLQLGLKETNFLGKGQNVNFSSSLSKTRNEYDISFTEPYFNNKSLSITTQLYSKFTDPASVNYETEDLGLSFVMRFPLAPARNFEARYSIFTSKVKADSSATSYERLLAGTETVSIIGYSINFDQRNSRYKPSSGFNFKLNQDLAGLGGTSNYIKNSFEYNKYKSLTDRLIGAFKIQGGNINGYNDKYAPLASNFKLGGKRLRGFKSGKIGPRTGNSYTGGQYYYLTSLETNFDLELEAFDITSTLFADFGSVWGLENPAYSAINDDHELRSSIGVNFNWDSAIGPINIIYANILASETTDTTDNLYFDIGYNF